MEVAKSEVTPFEYIHQLTATIESAEFKEYLIPEVRAAMSRSGYDEADIDTAVGNFFRATEATLQ